jgi:hypothetical protein
MSLIFPPYWHYNQHRGIEIRVTNPMEVGGGRSNELGLKKFILIDGMNIISGTFV